MKYGDYVLVKLNDEEIIAIFIINRPEKEKVIVELENKVIQLDSESIKAATYQQVIDYFDDEIKYFKERTETLREKIKYHMEVKNKQNETLNSRLVTIESLKIEKEKLTVIYKLAFNNKKSNKADASEIKMKQEITDTAGMIYMLEREIDNLRNKIQRKESLIAGFLAEIEESKGQINILTMRKNEYARKYWEGHNGTVQV